MGDKSAIIKSPKPPRRGLGPRSLLGSVPGNLENFALLLYKGDLSQVNIFAFHSTTTGYSC